MVNVRNYNPIWPEVIVWWGAGASKSLNLLTTDDIAKQITILAKEDSLKARIDDIYSNESDEIKEDLKRLLNFFENPSDLEEDIKIKQNYDWESLKKVINISPKVNDYVPIQELFNILDMSIQNRLGFTLPNGKLLEVNQLSAAREILKLLIIFLQSIQYKKLIKDEKEKVNPYYEFARAISQLMIEEGLALKDEAPLNNRLFYLESLAFICLNWDPILLWMLFYSNREMNHSSGGSYIGENCEKLKLYHDLGYFHAVRKVNGKNQEIWYPYNETLATRINKEKYPTGKKIRIGKFYFPHGCLGWRECPNCGKLTQYLGHEWSQYSKSLFPPSITNKFNFESKSVEEEEAYENKLNYGKIQCSYCGEMTSVKNTPIVMQTNYKLNYPPFIEEIQRDMKIAISKAKHFVFMGYSLPPDDIIYKSILATKASETEGLTITLVVGYDEEADDKFYNEEEAEVYWNKLESDEKRGLLGKSTYRQLKSIFRDDVKYRFYFKGIPNVFIGNANNTVKDRVKNLFYPDGLWGKIIQQRKEAAEYL